MVVKDAREADRQCAEPNGAALAPRGQCVAHLFRGPLEVLQFECPLRLSVDLPILEELDPCN